MKDSDESMERKTDHSKPYTRADDPSLTAFPVARAGYPLIWTSAFVTGVFALLNIAPLAILGLLATLFIGFFFRDPDRVTPNSSGVVVSPADGKVIRVEAVSGNPFNDQPQKKISIFMSVFNVHVNRIPHEGKIIDVDYRPGKFVNASLDKASEGNERNALLLETANGRHICVVQIAGLIARRIICHVQPSDRVLRGQRFGMICFGSRLDVYLPNDADIRVRVGQRVQAGASVLGILDAD